VSAWSSKIINTCWMLCHVSDGFCQESARRDAVGALDRFRETSIVGRRVRGGVPPHPLPSGDRLLLNFSPVTRGLASSRGNRTLSPETVLCTCDRYYCLERDGRKA
jgi:hypothetical protein